MEKINQNIDSKRQELISINELKSLVLDFEDGIEDIVNTQDRSDFTLSFKNKLLEMREKFQHIFITENGSTYFILESGESLRIKKKLLESSPYWQKENFQEYELQPPMEKIFFIPDDVAEEINFYRKHGRGYEMIDSTKFKKRKELFENFTGKTTTDSEFRAIEATRKGSNALIGEEIRLADQMLGATVFEINPVFDKSKTVYSLNNGILVLIGKKLDLGGKITNFGERLGATHWGHKVSEIIK